MKGKILWIENRPKVGSRFTAGLREVGYQVESVNTGKQALEKVSEDKPDLVIINATSSRTNGKTTCRSLWKECQELRILVLCDPIAVLDENCASAVLVLPFTLRKLINRISLLLPLDTQNFKWAGPIGLDESTRRVYCDGREARLTPRLFDLLNIFINHPGEVLERNQLFKEVWHTDYTADMRALDVHISWLRQTLEIDPRHPSYLKTVRGTGYRLDIQPQEM